MMGVQQPPQSSLFYTGINIEKRVRSNHPLRKVSELIDFDFAYNEVRNLYGNNGNVSGRRPGATSTSRWQAAGPKNSGKGFQLAQF